MPDHSTLQPFLVEENMVRVFEAEKAVEDGCEEPDRVIAIGKLRGGEGY